MAVDDTLTGKKFGDYTIQGLLGRGGMSRVYKGYDENLDRYAAVKVISGDTATTSQEEYARRFQFEARAIARLRHPNIVGVYQFGRSEGIYYMAQVFLEGKDLRALLQHYAMRQQRIPRDEILRIVSDITSALDYAHELGVIHRDIKPSNIMLEKTTGRAILMDFGLALSVSEGTMGDTFGSAHYIAPEQAISSAKAVPQSDLYSLGIVLYEMLTGTVPFDDPSVMSVALKHLNELPPPPTMYNPDLSPAVEAVILRLLDKDPKRRHASGRELYTALEEAFEQDQLMAEPSTAPPITDLLDSDPGALAYADAPLPDWSEPTPEERDSTPPPRTAGQTALADRFARRREEREAEAGLRGLEIDDDALNQILDSYADPAELRSASVEDSSQRRAAEAARARRKRRRRSRLGAALAIVLLLIVLGGGLWFGLGLGDDNGDDSAGADGNDVTSVAAGDASATADTPDAETPTGSTATADTSDDDTPTGSKTATSAESSTAAAIAPTGTAAATEAAPTETATRSATPVTPTTTPTTTSEPSQTPEAATSMAVTNATPADRTPNVRLVYSNEPNQQGQFLLVNLTTDELDVSDLIFEREQRDGRRLQFEANQWDRPDISASPDAMPARSCFQLVTTNGTAREAGGRECPNFLGYYRTNATNRYFWIAEDEDASFTVTQPDRDEPLAICATAARRCEFYVGPGAETVVVLPPSPTPTTARTATSTPIATSTPTSTAVPATPTPTGGVTLDMRYDDNSFLLINASPERVDVSDLVFRLETADGTTRSFEARQWDRADIISPPSSMSGGGCYQLVRANVAQVTPPRNVCGRFLGWFRTGITSRYFWISDDEDASFAVLLAGSDEPLTTCPLSAERCEVVLPPQD